MEEKILLALQVVAGLDSICEKWSDFFSTEMPPKKPYEESIFEYRKRIEKIIKKEAVNYLGKLLSDLSNNKNKEQK